MVQEACGTRWPIRRARGRARFSHPAAVEGLMLGGLRCNGPSPARGRASVQPSVDMEHHVHHGAAPSHGFKVGIATLA